MNSAQLSESENQPLRRCIDIFVVDGFGQAISDAIIYYRVNGIPAGSVENVQGHARIQLQEPDAAVGVTINYDGNSQYVQLAQNQDSFTLTYDANVVNHAMGRHIALFVSIVLFGIARLLAFIFEHPTTLQNYLILGTFSLAVGTIIIELTGLFKGHFALWQKLLLGAIGGVIVFIILHEVLPT